MNVTKIRDQEEVRLLSKCIDKVVKSEQDDFYFDIPRPHVIKGDILTKIGFTKEETITIIKAMQLLINSR